MTQKILVVDDSRTVRTVVEWVFHGSPYTIISAGTASDGIRLLREHLPSVALIDYSLPDQSGFELCQEIRRDASLSHIPLVMLGGTWGGFDETRAEACADDYIYKPFKTDALIEKVSGATVRATRPPQVTPGDPAPAVPAGLSAPTDGRTMAGMPAVLGMPGAPSMPALTPPTPPAAPADPGGFRRVGAGSQVAGEVEEPIGPPPLPQASGPRPAETPLPEPAPALPKPPPMPALIPPEPAQPEPEAALEQPALAPLPAVSPPAVEPLPPVPDPMDAGEPTGQTAAVKEEREVEESEVEESEVVEETAVEAAPAEEEAPSDVALVAPVIDENQVRELVREMLPPIVKEVLAGLLRQTIGTRVQAYATKKIDSFVESELPAMAEKAIDAQLEVLYANVEE